MRSVLAALALLLMGSVAWADLPPPPGTKTVKPRVRFEGVDKYADFAFFLKFHSSNGNPFAGPARYVKVKDAEPFVMDTGRRIGAMQLFAVAREDAAKLKAKDPSLAWLDDKTPGALMARLTPPSTTGSAKDKEVPVTTYRVKIEDKKLSVEQPKRSAAPSDERSFGWAFGIVFAVSFTMLGLWFARRGIA